jgi:hypothetical protein
MPEPQTPNHDLLTFKVTTCLPPPPGPAGAWRDQLVPLFFLGSVSLREQEHCYSDNGQGLQ